MVHPIKFYFLMKPFFLIRPHSGISKSSWLQTIINLASSIILSLSSLSECTQKYSQKMHQKPWVLSVIHSNTKNTHHLKLVFNSTANLDIQQLWFLIVESFCYSIILSFNSSICCKKNPNPQTIPTTNRQAYK